MQPNLVVTKSAWSAVTFWRILFFWTIIPLIVMICGIISNKCYKIEFYDDYYVETEGVFSKSETKTAYAGIISVGIRQSFGGRICGYGTLVVDMAGKHDIYMENVCRVREVKAYLEKKVSSKGMQNIIMN